VLLVEDVKFVTGFYEALRHDLGEVAFASNLYKQIFYQFTVCSDIFSQVELIRIVVLDQPINLP